MKKLIVLALCLSFVGCAANKQFVDACGGFSSVILPEYEGYVKADSSISESTKKIRLESSAKFQQLIDAAKEQTK
jgi:hypothetical protein